MKTKVLIDTNPYLKNATKRKRLVQRSVRTSCGVEGISVKTNDIAIIPIPSRGQKRIYINLTK